MSLMSFIQASAHSLPMLADGSVQMIATSPPYYGLRKYSGAQDVDWPAVDYAPMPGLPEMTIPAMRSPLGNEPTLEAYIAHLILCLREWRRVLRDDGIAFVNLGDSFANDGKWGGATGGKHVAGLHGATVGRERKFTGLKPKDLMMVPARFALAAQADGWFVRSDIIGRKVAPMPESVTDRPTRSHEHIFMLTKRATYFCDMEAVREDAVKGAAGSTFTEGKTGVNGMGRVSQANRVETAGRNLRDVLRFTGDFAEYFKSLAPDELAIMAEEMAIAIMRGVPLDVIDWRPQGFSAAHFATWPEAIPDMLIRMGTSERGACPHCGAPWVRVVEKPDMTQRPTRSENAKYPTNNTATNGIHVNDNWQGTPKSAGQAYQEWRNANPNVTIAWQPSCNCLPAFSDFGVPVGGDDIESQHLAPTPAPCTVLDPFSGSGTTVKVAARLGRQGIGVDISAEYLDDITAARMGDGFQMEMI